MAMIMKFLPFIFFSLVVLLLLLGYSSWRIFAVFRASVIVKTVYGIGLGLIVWSIYFSMFASIMGLTGRFLTLFSWIGFVGLGLFMLLFFLFIVRDTLYLVLQFGPGNLFIKYKQFFLRTSIFIVVGLGISLTGYSIYCAMASPKMEHIVLRKKNLAPDLDGFRFVQISDLHIGPILKKEFLERTVNLINAVNPDAVMITGDLMDGSVSYLGNDMRPLAKIQAKFGTFFSTGNHEYYSGIDVWIPFLKKMGIKVLINEHDSVQVGNARLLIVGVPDAHGAKFSSQHRQNYQAAMAGAPFADFRILLAHQPRQIKQALKFNFDLFLAGHTHGGQIFPFHFFVRLEQPYVRGLHRELDTWIYVHRGTGFWGPPMRLGASPEITIFELKAVD